MKQKLIDYANASTNEAIRKLAIVAFETGDEDLIVSTVHYIERLIPKPELALPAVKKELLADASQAKPMLCYVATFARKAKDSSGSFAPTLDGVDVQAGWAFELRDDNRLRLSVPADNLVSLGMFVASVSKIEAHLRHEMKAQPLAARRDMLLTEAAARVNGAAK